MPENLFRYDALKSLASLFMVLAFGLPLKATHVVGGEMVYDYLGNDSYYVHLTVYTDCYNGSPRAISSDSTGVIAVYNGLTFKLAKNEEVWRSDPVRLNKVYYNCVVPPGDVCVDKYVFDTIFVLKANDFGYYITFQRCCRNGSILNLVEPLRTGATYFAYIPPFSAYGANSNPRFKNRPPNYLCVNEQIVIDHSAIDADGDSLSYRICTPYNMREIEPSKPILPSSPPYMAVTWKSPYNDTLPLPVKKHFKINRETGRLQFLPTKQGQYVFGVCVDEFRNGQYLSTSFRDYQFNIMPCAFNVKADFELPKTVCADSLVLKGNAKGAKNVSWMIEQPDGNLYLSNKTNDIIKKIKPGNYTVSFIASDGNCADTATKEIVVLQKNEQKKYLIEACKQDSVIMRPRNFYNEETLWNESENLFTVKDTLVGYLAQNDMVFIHSGNYKGCTFIDSYLVKVYADIAEIQLDTTPHCLGDVLKFSLLNNAIYDTWVWNSDKQTKNIKTLEVFVPFGKEEEIALYIEQKGCSDSMTIYFKNKEKGVLEFETFNVISPNGDGLNECFRPAIKGGDFDCNAYSLFIYNRWGGKVFEVIDNETVPCWDGTNYRGSGKVQAGVYYYFLEVDGFKKHGTITVVY